VTWCGVPSEYLGSKAFTARTARSLGVHGFHRVAASNSDLCRSKLLRQRKFRSGSLVFPASSSTLPVAWPALEAFRRSTPSPSCDVATACRIPALTNFAPLQSSLLRPGRISRPPLVGFAPSSATVNDIAAATDSLPRTFAPPSTCSPASTPATDVATVRFGFGETSPNIACRPRGFAPPRRFTPPFAPSPGLPSHLAMVRESRACCIPLPILGFVEFQLAAA